MTATLQLPVSKIFATSCSKYDTYPLNIVNKSNFLSELKASHERLTDNAPRLLSSEDQALVHIRDWDEAQNGFQNENRRNDSQLRLSIGEVSLGNTQVPVTDESFATMKDPRCRFIYIFGESSRTRLRITLQMLQRLFTHHQVMPAYLDFISVFGEQLFQRHLRFSGFKEQITLSAMRADRIPMPEIMRSGRQYQICYNLTMVEVQKKVDQKSLSKKWPIRQAAFHHQFDVETGTQLWICTKGGLEDLRLRTLQLTGPSGRSEDHDYSSNLKSFKSTLAVHSMYCNWAVEGWRWYIRYLEDLIGEETSNIIDIPKHQSGTFKQRYNSDHLRILQMYEDHINESIDIMQSNVATLTSLRTFYEQLFTRVDFPDDLKQQSLERAAEFYDQINGFLYELQLSIKQADLLVRFMAGRKLLVQQDIQTQNTETMENMTAQSQKESIMLRIVALLTFFFLPATFVSTFFSTDVVKYQGSPNGGNLSRSALRIWLLITLPLTFATVGFLYATFRYADGKRRRRIWLPTYANLPDEEKQI